MTCHFFKAFLAGFFEEKTHTWRLLFSCAPPERITKVESLNGVCLLGVPGGSAFMALEAWNIPHVSVITSQMTLEGFAKYLHGYGDMMRDRDCLILFNTTHAFTFCGRDRELLIPEAETAIPSRFSNGRLSRRMINRLIEKGFISEGRHHQIQPFPMTIEGWCQPITTISIERQRAALDIIEDCQHACYREQIPLAEVAHQLSIDLTREQERRCLEQMPRDLRSVVFWAGSVRRAFIHEEVGIPDQSRVERIIRRILGLPLYLSLGDPNWEHEERRGEHQHWRWRRRLCVAGSEANSSHVLEIVTKRSGRESQSYRDFDCHNEVCFPIQYTVRVLQESLRSSHVRVITFP